MKKYILLILIALLLSGCTIPNTSKKEQTPTNGKIIVEKSKYDMIAGEYHYNGKKMKINKVNNKSVGELAKDFDTLSVEKNTRIEIDMEDNPSITVMEWKEDGEINEVTISDNQITVPSQPGVYIYEVKGKWPNGLATFVFDVEVH